jgi:hypothetical protein
VAAMDRGAVLRELERPRTVIALVATTFVVLVVIAALGGDGDEPGPPTGTPKEAVDVIEAFKRAIASRDFAMVCDQLYTADAREASGGDNCQSVLRQETARLKEPRLKIVSLTVGKRGAVVTVEASQAGREPAQDTIQLVREGGRFRIASAGRRARG